MKLGVNVDHVATLRTARGTLYPDPVVAALLAEHAGCDSVVVHLREDRRHIKERDVVLIKETIRIPLNLEMSINRDIVGFAVKLVPQQATLVPERRRELTTEGGLDLVKGYKSIEKAVNELKSKNIQVSLFVSPFKEQIERAKKIGVDIIEINTGRYSEAYTGTRREKELKRIRQAAELAKKLGLFVAAGHGLDYNNVKNIAGIKEIKELNIGHSIICRSVFVGMISAVEEMKALANSKK